jgi:DNA-directed RNA polymerase specialized sigma24 family protein
VNDDVGGSITRWLTRLEAGDVAAVQPLWERYFEALVGLARKKLCALRQPRTDVDEEDVALSAFHSFCAAARRGRFPRLEDREDLWRVLVYVTACKARDLRKRRSARKRGGGRVALEADLRPHADGDEAAVLDRIIGSEPSPEFAAQVAEECERMLRRLSDDTQRRIALLKLACYTHEEIREQLGCSPRTVTLKLELIRKRWGDETTRVPPSGSAPGS